MFLDVGHISMYHILYMGIIIYGIIWVGCYMDVDLWYYHIYGFDVDMGYILVIPYIFDVMD